MASKRQYHCLDGVLRDLIAALEAGDEGEGWARLFQFARIIADITDILDDDDTSLPDSDDESGEEPDAQMELPHTSDSHGVGGAHEGHDSMRGALVGGSPAVESPMERVRRLARQALVAEELGQLPGRADAVVRTVVERRRLTGG